MSGPVGHLGDVLSALLDGELAYDEAVAARAHLQACPFCRAELDATASTRTLVRSLPMLDPPHGLIDTIIATPAGDEADEEAAVVPITSRRPARSKPMAAVAGMAAAVALFALLVGPHRNRTVSPPVSTFVDAHAPSSAGDDPISGLAPVAVPASFSP